MARSIDDLPTNILVKIIGNLSYRVNDYLSLKLVSSRWIEAINCYFELIIHLVQRKIDEEGSLFVSPDYKFVSNDGLVARYSSNSLGQIISYMKLLPNLKAVSVEFSNYRKKDFDTLFNYLNTRPTITSLELVCNDRHTELRNDVKLKNIRNFALNADSILSKKAIKRLFQPDHELTQLYVNTMVSSELPFEDGISILKRMPTLKMFSQQNYLSDYGYSTDDGTDLLIYTKQPGISFENLESYSFYADYGRVDFLNYVDNFVACCPNLKNIDCWTEIGCTYGIQKLNLRAHTNVENLVIRGMESSWELVLKVLEMFPMIKNLKLQDMRGIGHNQISQALLKLPNLSLLYLQNLQEIPQDFMMAGVVHVHVHSSNAQVYKDIVQVDCEALKEEYNSKYGRDLQIVRRDYGLGYDEPPFKHGFNFMKNIFWSDWPPKLLTD